MSATNETDPGSGTSRRAGALERIDVKIPLKTPGDFGPDPLVAVFGRWRLEEGEEILDLADYCHVPEGPGCLLVGQRWHFGVHWGGGMPALFLSTRRDLAGSLEERFAVALRLCLEKGRRLLSEPEMPRGIELCLDRLELIVNDRLFAPNTPEGDAAVRPAVTALLARLYGQEGYRLEREPDPARRLGYRVEAPGAAGLTPEGLLSRL